MLSKLFAVGLLGVVSIGCGVTNHVIFVDPAFSAEDQEMIVEGADIWNNSVGANITVVVVGEISEKGFANIVRCDDPACYKPGDVGRAFDGRGLVYLNAAEIGKYGHTYMRTMAAHEIGHFFGLKHVYRDPMSVMNGNAVQPAAITVTSEDMVEWFEHN